MYSNGLSRSYYVVINILRLFSYVTRTIDTIFDYVVMFISKWLYVLTDIFIRVFKCTFVEQLVHGLWIASTEIIFLYVFNVIYFITFITYIVIVKYSNCVRFEISFLLFLVSCYTYVCTYVCVCMYAYVSSDTSHHARIFSSSFRTLVYCLLITRIAYALPNTQPCSCVYAM